ncbi:MAG: hypothetical protein Q7R52_02505 [archaeon]|nr:hypothetical protein [archaeon]
MKNEKKKRIIKELKKNGKSWGPVCEFHIKGYIKDFDKAIKNSDSRDGIEAVTGIKIRKIGPFIF